MATKLASCMDGDNDDFVAVGGSTDVRLVSGDLNEVKSIYSRIMVLQEDH